MNGITTPPQGRRSMTTDAEAAARSWFERPREEVGECERHSTAVGQTSQDGCGEDLSFHQPQHYDMCKIFVRFPFSLGFTSHGGNDDESPLSIVLHQLAQAIVESLSKFRLGPETKPTH